MMLVGWPGQILDAVEYCHLINIVHRDLKLEVRADASVARTTNLDQIRAYPLGSPWSSLMRRSPRQNVLVSRTGQVKLIGTARASCHP